LAPSPGSDYGGPHRPILLLTKSGRAGKNNRSWHLFPYIWNEIKFQVAYQSELEFVGRLMQEVAEEELGPEMEKHVRVYRDLLAQTPVDRLTVQEKPVVFLRVSDNTWIEAIVRLLVDPKRAGGSRRR
jgi:hypothetical protein